MGHKAKLTRSGHSQTVHLPKQFRFKSDHVLISWDERTGNMILSEDDSISRKERRNAFLKLLDQAEPCDEFDYGQHEKQPAQFRDPLATPLSKGGSQHEGDA